MSFHNVAKHRASLSIPFNAIARLHRVPPLQQCSSVSKSERMALSSFALQKYSYIVQTKYIAMTSVVWR
eukprot:scaffold70488_cov59-Attheya_sp.AAC.3